MTQRFAIVTILTAAAAVLNAQWPKTIDVNEPRPLWRALDQLETIVGLPINYEDVPYENAADLRDISTRQSAAAPAFHAIVPRSGHVTAQIPALTGTAPASEALADVNLLLRSYRESELPGDFEVEQRAGELYVTAAKVRGADGVMRAVTSPLAAPVTIPETQRTLIETVGAILDGVNQVTGVRIVTGSFPIWPLPKVSFGASDEPARDALTRLFARMPGAPWSYRLIFEPGLDQRRDADYVLNITRTGYVPRVSPSAQ